MTFLSLPHLCRVIGKVIASDSDRGNDGLLQYYMKSNTTGENLVYILFFAEVCLQDTVWSWTLKVTFLLQDKNSSYK